MSEIIILDTHIWLWFINGNLDRIPPGWIERIEAAEQVGISPVSCYEIALAHQKGRLVLPALAQEWFDAALDAVGIKLFPLTAEVTCRAVSLSPVHRDPFDRMIIATALSYGAKLASVDRSFLQYAELADCLMR